MAGCGLDWTIKRVLIATHKRICSCGKMSILQIDELLIKLRGMLVSGHNSD